MHRIMKWKKALRHESATWSFIFQLLFPSGEAQTWIGANGANYNVSANWSGGAVPVSGSPTITNKTRVVINNAAPTLAGTGALSIKNSGSILDVQTGGSLTMAAQLQTFGDASVTVSGGCLTAENRVYIGKDGSTNMAVMNVTAGGFTVKNSFQIGAETTLGKFVNGTLNQARFTSIDGKISQLNVPAVGYGDAYIQADFSKPYVTGTSIRVQTVMDGRWSVKRY